MHKKIAFPPCRLFPLIASFAVLSLNAQQKKWQLFRQDAKNEWYSFLQKTGKDQDPSHVFQFENNMIHVSGEDFGYLVSERSFTNFHLTLQFKWGEKRYPPRENDKRDAGILFFVQFPKGDVVWPRSIEFQIQQGDCGDFWMVDSATIAHSDSTTRPRAYSKAAKIKDAEKPKGEWNTAEIIVKNGMITLLLNGDIVNTATKPSISEGRIILQSEGAEIYYRNVFVEEY